MSGKNSVIKCRAAVLYEEGVPMKIEDILIDPPQGDEIRLKMVSAGICASDAHYVWGEQKVADFQHTLPLVLGHEGAGIVESVGPDCTDVVPGDHVLTTFMPRCGNCGYCQSPVGNFCPVVNLISLGSVENKKFTDETALKSLCGLGVYSEYILVKPSQIVKIAKEARLDHACIISCSIATGFYSATNMAKVTPGSTCAVWGLGGIGLNALYGCKYNGAKNIIGIDNNDDKQAIAEEFGCTHFINPKKLDKPVDEYLKETYLGGVDFAFECIGNKAVIDIALKSLAPNGTFALVGLPTGDTMVTYPAMELLFGRRIVGGLMGNKKCADAYNEIVDMYVKGQYDVDRLISNKFTLDQINEAFDTLKDGNCVRSIIEF